MSWLEDKIREDAVVRLALQLGLEEAAKTLKISVEEMARQIAIARYRHDSQIFAKERLKIIDKSGSLSAFNFNGPQSKIQAAILRQKMAGKPVRIALLKARQFGGSTEFQEELFKDTMLRSNRSSLTVAHDLDSARHLREMSYRFYEHYDFPKPTLKKESDKWWKFLHIVNKKSAASSLRIDTADELSGGHSLTLHNLHLSEIQNWRNAQELVKGLFPTVPPSPDTMIFMEGTGAGVGNYWYDFCMMAQDPSTEWEFVFVPWFEIMEYSSSFDNAETRLNFESSLDSDERLLFNQGVGLEQLHWRRGVINGTLKGDMDAFHQQYPATPDEAFITSGRPVFPMKTVKKKIAESKEPLKTGYLRWKTEDGKKTVYFDEDDFGYWKLWENTPSHTRNLYVCGADVAEGLEVIPELGNRGGDYSAARILRRDSRKMVATFHARLDTDLFADELRKAFYYWKAPLFPEQNAGGGGNVVISRLRDDPVVELIKTPSFGKKRLELKEEWGWETTGGKAGSTKRMAIDDLHELIREESFEDLDKEFWMECSTYVRDEKGSTNAQSRKFDDLVMATAITFQADKLLPMVFKPQTEVKIRRARDIDFPQKGGLTRESVMADTLTEF
jgi:hypothetical protein